VAIDERTARAGQDGTVGVAVVGAGYWGPNLIRNFFATPGCRVVSVCDQSPARLEAAQLRFPGVGLTPDFDDLLRDPAVDAIAIATPVGTHGRLAKRALEAGKHVLVEKPLAASTAEAEELVELAARRNLTLMVDHTFVYTGAVRRIKQMIDTGELGNLFYYDSVRVNLGLIQHDVSVIWDLATHDFSIMDYLLPQQPRSITAAAVSHFPGGLADVAYLTVHFDGGLIAHFHVNWLSPVKVRQVLIGGERRMVQFDDIQPTEKVKVYDRGVQWYDNEEQARFQKLVGYRLGDMYAPMVDQTEALLTECKHFVECVRTGETPLSDGQSGLRVVRLLEAAEESARRNGETVQING
jgi:predicted dehydrogenase